MSNTSVFRNIPVESKSMFGSPRINKWQQCTVQGCLRWAEQQTAPVHHHVFPGVNHLDMLRTEEPTDTVAGILKQLNTQLETSLQLKAKSPGVQKLKLVDVVSFYLCSNSIDRSVCFFSCAATL